MFSLKYIFGLLFCAVFLFACAPSSSGASAPIFWQTSLPAFESFVISFVENFDPKFVNATVLASLVNIHEIKLNTKAFLDTDGTPYRLTIVVSEKANATSSFLLINEEDINDAAFPAGTLAFRLNDELTNALDAKFKRFAH